MLKDKHSRHTIEAERSLEMALEGRGDGLEVCEEVGGRGEEGSLAVLVGQLLGIGEEGCFRLVVGFL